MTSRAENESGPNYLGYNKHMVLKLFSGAEELLLPFSDLDSEPLTTCSEGKGKSVFGSPPLFADGMVTGISDFQSEKLKGLLDQSISGLTQDTDEVFDRILAKIAIDADIKEKGVSAFQGNASTRDDVNPSSPSFTQVYSHYQGLLQDGLRPEEALEKCSNDISKKLGDMEHNVEELLDAVMSKCRPMTCAEKQQLGQRIHKLPEKALDRVAEIIQNGNHHAEDLPKINVNLEEEDDATLWRLYAYVETVTKANKG